MLFTEIIAVYCESRMIQINTLHNVRCTNCLTYVWSSRSSALHLRLY